MAVVKLKSSIFIMAVTEFTISYICKGSCYYCGSCSRKVHGSLIPQNATCSNE